MLEQGRDRVVAAIAKGLLEEREAESQLGQLRADIDRAQAALERARFAVRQRQYSEAERLRFVALARDLPARLASAPPTVARDLLADWLEGITVDKVKRQLTIVVRRVPLPVLTTELGGRP